MMKTLSQKTKQAVQSFSKKLLSPSGLLLIAMSLLVLVDATSFAGGDLLTAAKQDVTANFGHGSTFMYILLVVELISSVAMYMKNKNILTLAIGLPVVMLVTATGFTLIGG